jgi:DNA-binding beta-propeller fold protein YncE
VNAYITILGANTIPGVTMSHDGKRLYVVNEGANNYGQCISELGTYPCNNPTGTTSPSPSQVSFNCLNEYPKHGDAFHSNGVLSIIDVQKAEQGLGQGAIMLTIASGCAPVRVVESSDGKTIWIAARGGVPCQTNTPDPDGACQNDAFNGQILAFDVQMLTSNTQAVINNAFKGAWSSGGTVPVGMALFGKERYLAVANSNRFTKGSTGVTSVAILDLVDPAQPPIVCPSGDIYDFPRGVTVGLDDTTVYVANFGEAAKQVEGGCDPK